MLYPLLWAQSINETSTPRRSEYDPRLNQPLLNIKISVYGVKLGIVSQTRATLWQTFSIAGVCLLVLSFSACYFSLGTRFAFEFLDQQFGNFVIGILAGWILTLLGFIARARMVTRAKRLQWTLTAFGAPWIAGLAGLVVYGGNMLG